MSANYLYKKRIFGATMLITGCCVGVGMIGLPIVSRLAGFMPASLAMFLSYLFTTLTGLFLLEATLWFDNRVNLPSIASKVLGDNTKLLTIFLFLFLFYCLFVAYLSAGGELFAQMLMHVLPLKVSHSAGTILCLIFIVSVSYSGALFIDGFNRIMILGMAVTYVFLVTLGMENIKFNNLLYTDWPQMFAVFPILLICFGYQNLVPSLTYYLHRDPKAIRIVVIIGNFVPFVIYFIWNFVIIGMLNNDPNMQNDNVVIVSDLLANLGQSSAKVMFIIKLFSLFAMLTSFLPSTLSFVDFVKDGFKNYIDRQNAKNDIFIYFLIFTPSTICALIYPQIFLHALSFAGGFVDVILFGILPSLVVLRGRHIYARATSYRVAGGAITPTIILIISLILLMAKLRSFYIA